MPEVTQSVVTPKKLAVLVSGGGSNMLQLIKHGITIDCVITDRPCKATAIAEQHGIETYQFKRDEFLCEHIAHTVKDRGIDLVVMAGFLSILDKSFIENNRVVNIHPSLLPKYGGKGMYGMCVHEAVFANKDNVSGCTVHYVNEGIDTGEIIAQTEVDISQANNAQEIQKLVIGAEWELLQRVVDELVQATDNEINVDIARALI